MIKHFRHWRRWAKHNSNGVIYKLAVLFGIIYSPYWDYYSMDIEREWATLAEELKEHERTNNIHYCD